MLTIDDANTILEKYKDGRFWYPLELHKLDLTTIGKKYQYDFFEIEVGTNYGNTGFFLNIFNNCADLFYATNPNGDIIPVEGMSLISVNEYFIRYNSTLHILWINISGIPRLAEGLRPSDYFKGFIPRSPTQIPVINGEFDDKFYITFINGTADYSMNGHALSIGTDENGTYFTLPEAVDGAIINTLYDDEPLCHITFSTFKELPIPYIPTLYKGTPQSIQVLNSEDDDPISDYQTYYQGRQLKDNTIHLPYDADDYINIIVDLKDYRYPFATVKLKAPTVIYQANSQSDVETAIENGIQTLQIGDTETEVTLNSIELSNVTLINSNIQVSESILTDCQIIDTSYTDNGGNNITSTIFKDTDYTNTAQSNYNEVTFNECNIHDSEINLTGTITDSTITDTLIISDGVINIRDNTFTGVGSKDYFPSHLYLTGDYTVTGNTFNLEGEWTELEYNMCLIKATNDFNPSQFIRDNIFNLNITYDEELTNTFYYNIVDDDKIRAVRL